MDLPNGARREVLKRYLYQEMSDAEREDIEEQFLQDETFFYELVDLENELIDSYARGDLGAEEKARFVRSLGLLPERRERLVQAVALQRLIAAEHKSGAPSEQDEPPEVVIARPRRRRTLAEMFLRPSPAFAYGLACVLMALLVTCVLAYVKDQRTTARELEVKEQKLRRANQELDEAKRMFAELANKQPDEAGIKHTELAKTPSESLKESQATSPLPRATRNTPAAAPTRRASRANRNPTAATAGVREGSDEEIPTVVRNPTVKRRPRDLFARTDYRNRANEEAADLVRFDYLRDNQFSSVRYTDRRFRLLEDELNKVRKENEELKGSIPEVVHAPEEYQPKDNVRGATANSSARPGGLIKIGPRTTSVELTLKLIGDGLNAEDVPHLRFDLMSGKTARPVVPLNKTLSRRRSLVVNLRARDLSDGTQSLRVLHSGSTLGDYELRVKRY
ncbi:MAG: hypothetical protein ABW208_01720 [Pyrinomonadaceae bacterium]